MRQWSSEAIDPRIAEKIIRTPTTPDTIARNQGKPSAVVSKTSEEDQD